MLAHHIEIAVISFITALVFSPLIAHAARRWGVVSGSAGVRWSHEPKPLLGGLSIVLALAATLYFVS